MRSIITKNDLTVQSAGENKKYAEDAWYCRIQGLNLVPNHIFLATTKDSKLIYVLFFFGSQMRREFSVMAPPTTKVACPDRHTISINQEDEAIKAFKLAVKQLFPDAANP